jgi:hypothetical protein
MNKTAAAQNWLSAMGHFFSNDVLADIVNEAKRVAEERNATCIGRNHLEIALERLAAKSFAEWATEQTNPRWVKPLTDDELPF